MGFYATDERAEVLESHQENLTPPSKNRVWNFFTTSETCTGFSESQPVESHQEKLPTSTTTVSGVRYYGYRLYIPEIGIWASRDPIGERGGHNLYGALKNNPVNRIDKYGLSCGDVRDEGFNTPEEKTKIDAMQAAKPPCPIPKIECKCFCDSDVKGYYQGGTVTICRKWGGTDDGYRKTRKHELSHAFDQCKGAKLGCSGEGLKKRICSELRAYSWGSGIGNKAQAIAAAVQSTKKACPTDWIGGVIYETFAGDMYDQCVGLGPTDPLPAFPDPPQPSP